MGQIPRGYHASPASIVSLTRLAPKLERLSDFAGLGTRGEVELELEYEGRGGMGAWV